MKLLEKLKFSHSSNSSNKNKHLNRSSVHSVVINGLDGRPIFLEKYKGKHILFVNVASQCGFTNQYQDLQKVFEKYQDNLVIIGSPCNQFGGQEPGEAKAIQSFCERNFGVTFPLTEKLDVKGSNQHSLYEWLTSKSKNGILNSTVKWNFQKYLVNEKGEFVDFFYSITKPSSSKITKHFK